MSNIKTIKLGSQGLVVPAVGLGCMGMTTLAGGNVYGQSDEKEAIATIHRSLELGGNFLDTADLYGPHLNERLIAKAMNGNREKYKIASKFGYENNDQEQRKRDIKGRKKYIKITCLTSKIIKYQIKAKASDTKTTIITELLQRDL